MSDRRPVPLLATTDLVHGGRWTSLRGGGREWLWQRDEPGRATVEPGQEFLDAGGLEECVPTVRGIPDHGAAWSRLWTTDGTEETVDCPDFALARRISHVDGAVVAAYRLTAEPGFRFVWAAHALLELSESAVIHAPAGTRTRLFPEAAGLLSSEWPAGAPSVTGAWPAPFGLRLDRCGHADGTAVGAVLLGRPSVEVTDGPDRLTMRLEADGLPTSVALWRNLGGFPVGAAYRSFGVEPMIGGTFDLAEAGPDDAGVVPVSGTVRWRLEFQAHRRRR